MRSVHFDTSDSLELMHVQVLDCTEGADVGGVSEDYRTEVSSRAVIAERLLRAGRRL